MSWFSKVSVAPAPRAGTTGQRSLALRALLDGLHLETRPSVLDLGPPLAGNVKFFTALSCRVRVVDLHRSLCAEPIESRRAEAMPALLEQLLPLSPDDRYDAVLAWDVFDYMRIDQVKPLMARIVPRLRPHAQVLVLASMQSQIPAVPLRYRIVDRDHLDSEAPGREADHAVMRPCPRYRQSDLVHMMPTLTVRRCYLLRNGVKEYLLG